MKIKYKGVPLNDEEHKQEKDEDGRIVRYSNPTDFIYNNIFKGISAENEPKTVHAMLSFITAFLIEQRALKVEDFKDFMKWIHTVQNPDNQQVPGYNIEFDFNEEV